MHLSPAALVDARTGIIREIVPRRIPDRFPPSFALSHAVLGRSEVFSPWRSDASGAGHAFADPDALLGAAIGEAVERYCGNLVPRGLRNGSASVLAAEGHEVLAADEFALFSAEQLATPGFPVAATDRNSAIDWAEAVELDTGRPVLVPASMVWVAHSIQVRPARHPVIQAGLATGRSLDEAIWGALCEIVERDAMTLAWLGRRGIAEVDAPPWLERFAVGPRGSLSVRWLSFHSTFGLPVLGALVADAETGYLTLGMGVAPEAERAAVKAYSEALQLQLFVADLDDEHGPYMLAAAGPGSPLHPWRADRAYADSYRPDLRDVVDYGCHLQLHLDPRVQAAFLQELDADLRTGASFDSLPSDLVDAPDGAARIAALVARLRAEGMRAVVVELTTTDVAPTGLRTVRVLVPGMYSNAPHALPFLGGTRLGQVVPRPVPLPH